MRLVLFIFLLLIAESYQECSWNNCPQYSTSKNIIKVHLIPHTHDDLGWIKTVDQYYYGAKQTLVPVGVQYIYNTVIDELMKDATKRFSFAETGFLYRWWSSHNENERNKLQLLIENGQIELIGGGWVQNDEAASHYVDIIDQMTLGLRHLSDFFGVCGVPRVAWQIDPFGHSKELANIFALMGYTSLFFARIHYLEKQSRLQNKTLEFIWNASEDLKTQILTGAFYQDNYGPPEGFCWDALCGDDPIMDNIEMEGYNVNEKLKAFEKHVKEQVSVQRSNHVMLLMGSDFQYTNANSWYSNLDKLIKYVNSNSSMNIEVAYSTPSCYVDYLMKSRPHLTSKDDDFFPYASSDHSYWTGYFSSRPTFKQMIRKASSNLQLINRLAALAGLGASSDLSISIMKKASALAQHHDAVTGTAKENVTKDYVKRLHNSFIHTEIVINDFLAARGLKNGVQTHYSTCFLSNETICAPLKESASFAVTVFNPTGQNYVGNIRFPYYSRFALVENESKVAMKSQITKTFQISNQLNSADRAPYELTVNCTIPPLGYTTFFVNNSSSLKSTVVSHPVRNPEANKTFIENDFYVLLFDENGLLSNIKMKNTNETHKLSQQFLLYEGVDNTTSQPSGAYIFRPKTEEPKLLSTSCKLEVVKGELLEEIRQVINPWATQMIRLHRNKPEIEFDWVVGPIPKELEDSPVTKEIVTRYYSDINSGSEFFTDSSGRQMMKRTRNFNPSFTYQNTEPTSGNYYPVTNRVYIKDDSNQMTILTDRAQGATADNGYIELMVHRRCFYDDHWGVEEALDEPGTTGKGLVARGSHILLLTNLNEASSVHRPAALRFFHEPLFSFTNVSNVTEFKQNHRLSYSGLVDPLPDYLNLLSIEKWKDNTLLLRLEHLYQSGEDKENSKPKEIIVNKMFTEFEIVNMEELKLGGNRKVTASSRSNRNRDFKVELRPMEIRTYQIEVKRN
ncbi:unnamed protein product [Auanema sp. JU1783]|nr:unnamed protein product [Auanema sp. JU1783]